ncbi:EF hand domain-containing protein [Ditylenchus destructor]|nr:EF hand domain-containing protein [Ditylenchus destructor]
MLENDPPARELRPRPQRGQAEARHNSRERAHQCQHCEKSFGLKKDLERHALIHTGETPFVCEVCSHACNTLGNLNAHILSQHMGKPKVTCQHCGKQFTELRSLTRHLEGCHRPAEEKPHKRRMCHVRGKTREWSNFYYFVYSPYVPHSTFVWFLFRWPMAPLQMACQTPQFGELLSAMLALYKDFFPSGSAEGFCEHVFRTFDTDNSGFIDFKEFLLAINVTSSGTPEQKLEWAFRMYDIDGNGTIDEKEMIKMIEAIYEMLGPEVTKSADDSPRKRAKMIFEKMDVNNDKELTLKEFVDGCLADKELFQILTNEVKK